MKISHGIIIATGFMATVIAAAGIAASSAHGAEACQSVASVEEIIGEHHVIALSDKDEALAVNVFNHIPPVEVQADKIDLFGAGAEPSELDGRIVFVVASSKGCVVFAGPAHPQEVFTMPGDPI